MAARFWSLIELVDGVCKEVHRNVPVTEQLIKAVPSPYEAAQTAGIAVEAPQLHSHAVFGADYQARGQKAADQGEGDCDP